jgi:hypothetical protein
MPSGNLFVSVSDLLSRPVESEVAITLIRDPGDRGTGGGNVNFEFDPGGNVEFELEGIPNRGGPGSRYLLEFACRGYLEHRFAHTIAEGAQKAPQDVLMVRNPKEVRGIDAPVFSKLPRKLRDWLSSAQMAAPAQEDEELLGKRGSELYGALGDERKAGTLNIFAKASHTGTVGGLWQFLNEPLVFRRDRCFVRVDSRLPDFLADDEHFVSASKTLHEPLPGFSLFNSFKSDDKHANIQVTLQRARDGSFAADIDIDESSGFAHWGEVLRNFFSKRRTNAYAIHELLLAADLTEHTLDPGYELVMK